MNTVHNLRRSAWPFSTSKTVLQNVQKTGRESIVQ